MFLSGYGNLTPKTDLGKLATIIYALIGIPLMFLYMANIGDILGTSFKYMYTKFCRYGPRHKCSHLCALCKTCFLPYKYFCGKLSRDCFQVYLHFFLAHILISSNTKIFHSITLFSDTYTKHSETLIFRQIVTFNAGDSLLHGSRNFGPLGRRLVSCFHFFSSRHDPSET